MGIAYARILEFHLRRGTTFILFTCMFFKYIFKYIYFLILEAKNRIKKLMRSNQGEDRTFYKDFYKLNVHV